MRLNKTEGIVFWITGLSGSENHQLVDFYTEILKKFTGLQF